MTISKTYENCRVPVTTVIVTPGKIDSSKNSSSSAKLLKGDHHLDLPYSASWVEYKKLIDGEQQVDVRKEYWTKDCPSGRYLYTGSVPYSRVLGTPAGPPAMVIRKPSDDLVTFLRESAVTSALAGVRRSYMNNVQTFVERRQTVDLLVSKVRQLAAVATKHGRADLRRYLSSPRTTRKRVYKQIANEHLGFLFGVLPLVGEIEGLMQYLEEQPSEYLTGRGRRADVIETRKQGITSAYEGGLFGASGSYLSKQRVSVRCSLKYKVVMQNVLRAQQLGLNPLAVFYDLVPLSFLSDFLSNTGDFIRGLDPIPALEYSTGCWTLFCQTTVEGFVVPHQRPDGANYTYWRNSGSAEYLAEGGNMNRFVIVKEPSGSWLLQNNMTWGKAITAAALAIQRYVKPLRQVVSRKQFRYRGKRPKYLPPTSYRRP